MSAYDLTGPVFTQDHDGYVTTRPFSNAREIQPWEYPVEDITHRFVEPAPIHDPMEVAR